MYPIILRSVVDNMSLTNRDELLAQLDEQNKPDEAEAQMAEQKHAMEIEVQKTTLAALAGQAHESEAKAAKVQAEMMNIEEENNIAYAKIAASQVQPEINPEQDAFEKKIIIMEEIRKDRELNLREEDMKARGEQHAADMSAKSAEQDMLAQALAEPSPSEEMPQEPLV